MDESGPVEDVEPAADPMDDLDQFVERNRALFEPVGERPVTRQSRGKDLRLSTTPLSTTGTR